MLTVVLLGLAGAVPLALLLRSNAREQRAMNEAYDLWRATGQAVPGWDRHYAWSEPLPVDEPAWLEPAPPHQWPVTRSTPPHRAVVQSRRPVGSRWDEASALRHAPDTGRRS